VPEINNQVYPSAGSRVTCDSRRIPMKHDLILPPHVGDGSRPVLPETTNDGPTYRRAVTAATRVRQGPGNPHDLAPSIWFTGV